MFHPSSRLRQLGLGAPMSMLFTHSSSSDETNEGLALVSHWTYFMQILSNYNTKSLYHIENSVIKALKSDIFHSYTCEINIGDIWLQFEKLKKLRQMALSYRNIKNKC